MQSEDLERPVHSLEVEEEDKKDNLLEGPEEEQELWISRKGN